MIRRLKRFLNHEKNILQKRVREDLEEKEEKGLTMTLQAYEDEILNRIKHFWKSKVIWINVLMILSLFFSELSNFVMSRPLSSLSFWAVLNIFGRVFVRHELVLSEPEDKL